MGEASASERFFSRGLLSVTAHDARELSAFAGSRYVAAIFRWAKRAQASVSSLDARHPEPLMTRLSDLLFAGSRYVAAIFRWAKRAQASVSSLEACYP